MIREMLRRDSESVLEIYRMGLETRNATLRLHKKFGFRIIGTRERIAKLDGKWRDTVLLERRSSRIA